MQVVMLGVLGIVVAFIFMTQIVGGDEPAPEPGATDAAAAPVAGAPPVASSAGDVVPPDAVAVTPAPVVEPVPEAGSFKAGPGLPRRLVAAYEDGDTVVLMVQQEKGIEDGELRREVEALRSRGDTSVFIAAAQDVSDYSRVAQGVDLDRIPAIVVIHPKRGKGSGSGGLPVASVSYGYRGQQSVEQAVRDALYNGKQLPYHPG